MLPAKQYICDLNPYQPGLPIEAVARKHGLNPQDIIKLASNENPLGCSLLVRKRIEQALHDAHRYPEQHALLQALATHYHLKPNQLVIGNGSNDILDLIARVYLGPGDTAVSSQYAFAIYQIATQSAGAANTVVPAQDYGHDLAAMQAVITTTTRIVWIANPNNPTGTFIDYDRLQAFIESVPPEIVIVLDEAYYEYLSVGDQIDTTKWLQDYPNLIIVRTFSKIYGLAGLRIGYAMTSPAIAGLLNRVRQPFNGNSLALTAAPAALEDQAFVIRSYAVNAAGRDWLVEQLKALGLSCLPAYGNFVTCRLAEAAVVCGKLERQGIIVRPLTGYDMPDHLRITVGTAEENQRFIEALTAIFNGQGRRSAN